MVSYFTAYGLNENKIIAGIEKIEVSDTCKCL